MERSRVGIGIFLVTVALASCATGNSTTTLPAVPKVDLQAPDESLGSPDQAASDPSLEQPDLSLVPPAPGNAIEQENGSERAPAAQLPGPVPPPQASVETRAAPETEPTEAVVITADPRISARDSDSDRNEPARRAESPALQPADDRVSTGAASPPDTATPETPDASPPARSSGSSSSPAVVSPVRTDPPAEQRRHANTRPVATPRDERRVSGPLDELVVELPGEGWIYVGSEEGSDAVRLRRKRTRDGNTRFTFEMDSVGEYTLWFQRQDSRTGAFENQTVVVRADEARPNIAADRLRDSGVDSPPEDESALEEVFILDYTPAFDLIAQDSLAEGVRLLLDLSDQHDPRLARLEEARIADLMGQVDQLPERLQSDFLTRVAGSESAHAAPARAALLDVSIAREDPEGALSASNGLILAGEAEPAQLLDAANIVAQSGNREAAMGLAISALGDDVSPQLIAQHLDDEALFLHAKSLEELGPDRDLRRALEFYEAIVKDFPLSSRWEESRSRVAHLRRHYFDVR
ncbi:MAG: hypothetical protein ACLFP4_06405 [Spirochaetales bacterium]